MSIFLAMYGNKVSISEALFISVFAMIVVFLVLLIISYLIDISAFFINGSKNKKRRNEVKVENVVSNTENVKQAANKDKDLVVVIAAAIAAYLGTSADNVHIKSIRRINQTDTPWTERGLLSQIEHLL